MLTLIGSGGVVGGASWVADKAGWIPLSWERVPEGHERWLLWRHYRSNGDRLGSRETYLDCQTGKYPVLGSISNEKAEFVCQDKDSSQVTTDTKVAKDNELSEKLGIECWYRGKVNERWASHRSNYFLECDNSYRSLNYDDFEWSKEEGKVVINKKIRQSVGV